MARSAVWVAGWAARPMDGCKAVSLIGCGWLVVTLSARSTGCRRSCQLGWHSLVGDEAAAWIAGVWSGCQLGEGWG